MAGKITGADLLKSYNNRRKTSSTDKDEKEEKKKVTGADLLNGANRVARYRTLDTSSVNEEYINSFVSDTNSFFSGVEDVYNGINWGNASSVYDSQHNSVQELNKRRDTIGGWLYQNRSRIDEDSYNSLSSMLREYDKGASSMLDAFGQSKDFYSSFKTEEDYNKYVRNLPETKAEFDLEAGQAEIDDLEALYDQVVYGDDGLPDVYPSYEGGVSSATYAHLLKPYGYESADELSKDIADKKAYLRDAKRIQSKNAFEEEAKASPDFKDLSLKYHDSEIDDEEALATVLLGSDGNDYMEEDEKLTFLYLRKTHGEDKAAEYINLLKEDIAYRKAEDWHEATDGNILFETVFAAAAGIDSALNGIGDLFTGWIGGDESYTPPSFSAIANQMNAANNSGIYKAVVDTAGVIGGMLPSIGASVATGTPAVGLTVLGAGAAGNAYTEMINLGYDKGQARTYAALTAGSEVLLEKFVGGIPALGGGAMGKVLGKTIQNATLRVAVKIGSNMAQEALEEGIQTYLEPWFKSIATGEDYESPEFQEAAYNALLGALSSLVLGSGKAIRDDVRTSRLGKHIQKAGQVDTLTKIAQGFSLDSEAYKIASKVDKNTNAYQIGELFREVGANISEQNISDIVAGLEAKGIDSKVAKKLAKQYAAYLNNEMSLSDEQVATLENLDPLSDVLQSIVGRNTTVYQRTRGYQDVIRLAEEVSNKKDKKKSKAKDSDAEASTAQVVADSVGASSSSEEVISSTPDNTPQPKELSASNDHTTKLINTGEEVSIQKIDSIKDGNIFVRLNDGEVVNAKEISFGTADEALMYEAVTNMDVNSANAMIQAFDPSEGISGYGYAKGFQLAYLYGKAGLSESDLARVKAFSYISEKKSKFAYNLGKKAGKAEAKAKQSSIDKAVESATPTQKKGKVTYLDSSIKPVNEQQRSAIKAVEILSESIGNNWYIFASEVDASGRRVFTNLKGEVEAAPNGWYDPSTGDIYIDINAGDGGKGIMLFTMSHELTHFIKQWSPAKFKVFADFLLKQYGEEGYSVSELIDRRINMLKAKGRIDENTPYEKAYDLAYEELVADSCEAMLRDSNAIEAVAKLKAKDHSIWAKIKEFISKLVARIRKAYASLNPDSVEANMVLEMKDSAERLYALWTEALVDAAKSYRATNGMVQIDTESQSVSPMFSERTWTESEYVQEREETAKQVAKALGVSIDVAKAYIDDINSVARLIADDRVRLDYEPNLDDKATVLKKNSEYKFSVDMSTLCAKRLLFTGTFDAIQRQLPNTAFDSDDIVRLRQMMVERGYEVACGICYVESTRREIGTITQDFINSYKEAQKTGKPITRVNSEGKIVDLKKTKEQKETTVDKTTDKFFAEKDYTPTLADLNTTDIDLVKKEHPIVYEAYLNFMNARGQAKPKLLETRAEYKGEILKHFKVKSAVTSRNNAGGLRLQSFSDFEVPHLIDMMQITMDMARVGLKAQAYTKVVNFAEAFGNTGIKINLSLIAKDSGLDSKGNLIFDDTEGIDHKEAFRLRDKFSKNVGTILVGKNDAHIVAAMADPRIDYIIPFHKSSWKESLYDALGLTGYADYTDYQNEKYLDADRGKAKNFDPSEYWDFSKTGDENAQIYLEKCREDGRIPKFPQFQGYKGYWKLLIDFKMYDNDGVGSPQEAVRPIFDNATNEKILNEYKGGHRSFPEAKDVVSDFVKEYKSKNGDIRYSDREVAPISDEDYAKVEKHFGTTRNYNVAGYMLKNGKMLDFSGKHWGGTDDGFRQVDHRDIQEVLEGRGKDGVNAMIDMISNGNIRLMPETGGINLAVMPNESQLNQLRGYINHFRGEIVIDVDAVGGDTIHSWEYNRGTSSSKILSDIKAYFDNGTIPQQQSSLNQFRYSDRDLAPTFYSQMGKVVEGMKQDKFAANSVIPMLRGRGVKAEEIRWSGIVTFLEGKKSVTKQELQEFIAGSQLQIGEQMSDQPTRKDYGYIQTFGSNYHLYQQDSLFVLYDNNNEVVDEFSYSFNEGTYVSDVDGEVYRDYNDLIDSLKNSYGDRSTTRWEQYKLKGGENYREIVFTMPNSTYSNNAMKGHWGQDAEGVLAHARIQDFVVNGKKMLFIEEIQSDWHNEGHSKGYSTKEYEDAVESHDKLYNEYKKLDLAFHKYVRSNEFMTDPEDVRKKKHDWLRGKVDAAQKKYLDAEKAVDSLKEKGAGDTPDAPFKDTYHEYVLKRLLRMAAEEGYDSIGWTPAEIQSKRWSEEYAEGYRIEYDQDIPKFLKKYGRQWGAKVDKTPLPSLNSKETYYDVNREESFDSFAVWQDTVRTTIDQQGGDQRNVLFGMDGNDWIAYDKHTGIEYDRAKVNKTSDSVWSMDLTDSMKDSVLHEGQVLYSDRVTDKETLEFLENQEHVTVYRAMQLIDGKLYPPMNAYTKDQNGKKVLVTPSEIGAWEQSVERPDLIDPKTGKFKLDKGKVDGGKQGTVVPAAYNPYIHTSLSMLNDQFTSAYTRSNLVVVKGVVPKSELTSGYHAQYAKDSVGETEWHSGVVSTQLPESRKVILSRWFKPVEVMDNDVVAKNIKKMLGNTGIEIPYNVVSPKLRRSLEKIGVPIGEGRGIRNLPKKDEVKYSERGVADDGRKIYESNFPKGTPKSAKSKRILDYIQNVWSKNPIKLVISNGETSRTILAMFDPTFDEGGNTPTDASKIAGGNRNGNHTEQRVTLDLADDYYQIASESKYNYSKLETGKDSETHKDVKMWHYFVNDIYFAEYGQKGLTPYTVTINVKERDSGDFVYSFNAEKESPTRQTLHAAVNTYKGANGELFIEERVPQKSDSVKSFSENSQKYSDRDPDSFSNRSILANALDSAAQNDIERNKLEQYKQKIDLINAGESKLHEIRAQIKELSFAKGRRDTAKIRSLQNEATRIENRINTYDRQLLTLEASKPLKEVLNREKKLAFKRAEQKGKEVLSAYKEKVAQTQRELLTRYQESRHKAVEGRHKTELRHKILKVVGELNTLLTHPTKDKHVGLGLQRSTAEALAAINMDTVRADKRLAEIRAKMEKSNNPDEIARLQQTYNRIELQGFNIRERLGKLNDFYKAIKESENPLVANVYDQSIKDAIENLRTEVGNTSIMDMSLEQLESVYDMYRMVLHTIRTANKTFKANKAAEISTLSNMVMEEVEEVGGSKNKRIKILDFIRNFAWNSLKPIYAMRAIGSKTLTSLYENVREGEDTWAVDVSEAKAFFQEQAQIYGYKEWDTKQQYQFETKRGETFSLSIEQMMSLYAYSKRKQADLHLELGGFVFDEAIEVTEKKHGIPIKYTVNTANAHAISKDTLYAIIAKLTPNQRAFVDVMQDYLSTTMGAKGNEVSRAMYDIDLFKEKFYFPLKSAKQYMYEQNEVAGEVKIKNSGFSKETVVRANNPIILSNFIDVWANHVNDMSMYHAFVLPLEDFNRVFNYKTPTNDNYNTESVKMFIQNAYGSSPVSYIRQLLTDLNGGARVDSTAGIINKGISIFKKSAVFASLSVVIQQPSAIARAMAVVDAKYFVGKPSRTKHSETWAEVKKYAPVAIIKEMGYFDTGMGQSTVEWIKAKNTLKDKIDDVLSKAPAYADELAWCHIWKAVKREVAATTSLKEGSEEFLKKAGERFTEVVTRTQVYDSVLSRSGMMRSKDTGMKMATAFMAEPTTSLNMITDAIIQGKRGNKKYARKAIGSVAASLILNSILVSLVYAARDDDDEKTYAEKYLGTLSEELVDSFNILNMIPFVKDIISLIEGYDVERSDMSAVADLVDAWNSLSNGNKTPYRKVEDFAGAIASIFGLPVKNIMRDARGIYNVVNSFINGEKTTGAGIKDSILEGLTGEEKSNSQQLYEAIISGDQAQIDRIKGRFKDEDALKSAVRSALKEHFLAGDLDYETAIQYLIEYGEMDEDDVYWKLQEWEHELENGDTEDYSKYNDFFTAVETGKNLKTVIKEYTDNGVDKKTLASQITKHFKPLYIEMSKSERASLKGYLLNAYALLGYNRADKSKDIDNWLK